MRNSPGLSTFFVAAALTLAAPLVTPAEPAANPQETTTNESARAPAPARETATDADKYAARESEDRSAAEFKGGDVLIIGSTAAVILIIVLLVILL